MTNILAKGSALVLAASLLWAASAHAALTDYRLELADTSFHAGEKVPVRIRLVEIKTGKPVSGATLDKPKLIMKMPGMADMDGHAVRMTSDADGTLRVAADLVEEGDWVLDLAAKLPSEAEPVRGKLALRVVK